jgi:hypothetical protein
MRVRRAAQRCGLGLPCEGLLGKLLQELTDAVEGASAADVVGLG